MKLASFLSRILWRLLCTYPNSQPDTVKELPVLKDDALRSYLCGINLPLDDVKDGDVAMARLPLSPRGNHHILGLQKPPHHIQNRGFPHASNLKRGALTYQGAF